MDPSHVLPGVAVISLIISLRSQSRAYASRNTSRAKTHAYGLLSLLTAGLAALCLSWLILPYVMK